jgi:transposase
VLEQVKAVEAERDALIAEQTTSLPAPLKALVGIRGVGAEFAAVLDSDCSGILTTAVRLPPTRGWRRHLGRVVRSIGSREGG